MSRLRFWRRRDPLMCREFVELVPGCPRESGSGSKRT